MTKQASPEKKSRHELLDELKYLRLKVPEPLVPPRVFLTDCTPEAMQTELATHQERSAVFSDEGNIFEILSGLYTDGKSNIDVFLQGHAGGVLRVKRRDREVFLNKIAVALGLAIQPRVLEDLRSGMKQSFRGKGLMARFLYCVPASNIGRRDVNKRKSIPAQAKVDYFSGIKALLDIPPTMSEFGAEKPGLLTLSREALQQFQQFSQDVEHLMAPGNGFEHLQDFLSKLPGAALRIAGLCHVAQHVGSALSRESTSSREEVDDILGSPIAEAPLSTKSTLSMGVEKEISLDTLAPIVGLCVDLIVHAQAGLDTLCNDEAAVADAKWALDWITSNVETDEKNAYFFRQNDLHCSSRFKNSRLERLKKALEILRERHMISPQQTLPTRKPTIVFFLNPTIMKLRSNKIS